jgi:hypothetical protein
MNNLSSVIIGRWAIREVLINEKTITPAGFARDLTGSVGTSAFHLELW